MIARVQSYLLAGIDALPCEVEIDFSEKDLAEGDRPTHVVGLPDAAVKESNDRVRAALFNSNLKVPFGKVLINLAPADVQKAGPVYDLPIAIGLLAAQGVIGRKDAPTSTAPATTPTSKGDDFPESKAWKKLNNHGLDMRKFLFAGELALDGRLRPVKGVIALASLAKARNMQGVIVPWENGSEAAVVQGIEVYGVRTLAEAVGLLTGALEAQPVASPDIFSILTTATTTVDFLDVRGQEGVKRAMTLAAAGSHNILELCPSNGLG